MNTSEKIGVLEMEIQGKQEGDKIETWLSRLKLPFPRSLLPYN